MTALDKLPHDSSIIPLTALTILHNGFAFCGIRSNVKQSVDGSLFVVRSDAAQISLPPSSGVHYRFDVDGCALS